MKRLLIILGLIVLFFIIKVPRYVELNNLAIIEGVGVNYDNKSYTLYLKEIVPVKNDSGMSYKYSYYEERGINLKKILKNIKTTTKKKIYLEKVRFIVTNVNDSKDIVKLLGRRPKNIYHYKNKILKKLRAINS